MSRDFVQCEWPLPDASLRQALFETAGLGGGGRRFTITREGRLRRHTSEELGEYKGPRLVGDVELPIHGLLRLTARAASDGTLGPALVARFDAGRLAWIKPAEEVPALHDLLWQVCQELPGDYKSWGSVERDDPQAPGDWWHDCSSGCRHFFELRDAADEAISLDWGVCTNPRSHRRGLLTFEHQGCPAAEWDAPPSVDSPVSPG